MSWNTRRILNFQFKIQVRWKAERTCLALQIFLMIIFLYHSSQCTICPLFTIVLITQCNHNAITMSSGPWLWLLDLRNSKFIYWLHSPQWPWVLEQSLHNPALFLDWIINSLYWFTGPDSNNGFQCIGGISRILLLNIPRLCSSQQVELGRDSDSASQNKEWPADCCGGL